MSYTESHKNMPYRCSAENMQVVCYAVEGKLLEQVSHECGGGIEEGLQLSERDLLALVALVEDVLDLREPPGEEMGER